MQPNPSQEQASVVFLSKGLSSPLLSLSINLLNLHGPPVPACSGPLEPTEVQVTFVLPRIWGVNSPGSVGLVQRRPLHSQNASCTEDERKRHLNCASTQVQATRICHLECCNWSPCFQFDTPTHTSTFRRPPKGSFKTMEEIGSVLLLKRCPRSMPLGWSKNQTP